MSKIYILGHLNPDTDSVLSGVLLEKVLKSMGEDAQYVIPNNDASQETVNICRLSGVDVKKYYNISVESNSHFFLVDHSKRDVPGDIIGIIDHHVNESVEELKKKYPNSIIINEKSSSASLIIYKKYKDLGVFDRDDIIKVAIASAVDTMSFKSIKSSKEDEEYVKEICNNNEVDFDKILNIGFSLTDITNKQMAIENGYKYHHVDNVKIYSSFIQVSKISKIEKAEFNVLAKKQCELHDSDYFIFIIHYLNKEKPGYSETYTYKKNKLLKRTIYDHLTSRGNEIIPDVIELIKNNIKR